MSEDNNLRAIVISIIIVAIMTISIGIYLLFVNFLPENMLAVIKNISLVFSIFSVIGLAFIKVLIDTSKAIKK